MPRILRLFIPHYYTFIIHLIVYLFYYIYFFKKKDKVAIKIVDRSRLDSKNLRMLSREVSTLECVQHPYILRLFEGNLY